MCTLNMANILQNGTLSDMPIYIYIYIYVLLENKHSNVLRVLFELLNVYICHLYDFSGI